MEPDHLVRLITDVIGTTPAWDSIVVAILDDGIGVQDLLVHLPKRGSGVVVVGGCR